MARVFNGTTEYIEHNAALVTALPLTIAGWIYPADSAARAVCAIAASGNATGRWFYLNYSSAANRKFSAWVRDNAGADFTAVSADASSPTTLNTWAHGAAVFSGTSGSSTSISIYTNGAFKTTNTTTFTTPTTLDRTSIGRVARTAPLHFWSGRLAEVGIWNAALNDNEIAMLAAGIRPRQVRGESLVSYVPVMGLHSPEIDMMKSGATWTVTGTSQANHAPVKPFTQRYWGSVPLHQAITFLPAWAKGANRLIGGSPLGG